MAHHHTCRSRSALLAFRTHAEARLLRDHVLRQVPDPLGLCLMPDRWTPEVKRVARVLDDPRFPALQDWDLRHTPGWQKHRSRE